MINTFSKIWKFGKNRRGDIKLSLLFSFLRSAFAVCQLFSIITAIGVLIGNIAVKQGIIVISIMMVVCVTGNFITSYFEQRYTMKAGFFMVGDKRVEVGNLLRKLPLGFFNKNSVGKINATLTTTLSGVESAAVMVMVGIISGIFNALMMFIFLMFYDWRTGIISGIGMIVYILIVNLQMKISRKNAPVLQKTQSELAERSLNFLSGIKVTKAFSVKNGDGKLKEGINESCNKNIWLTKTSMPSQFLAGLTVVLFESAILIVSLCLYFLAKDIDIVKAIVLMIFSFMVYASLNQAGSMLSMIGLLDSGLNEVEEIEKNEPLEVLKADKKIKNNDIEFKNVSFSYGENQVLTDISTKISENSLTAVIGPSGSGKTTLCQLIPRFRDVCSGVIKIGGVDIRCIEEKELMAKISMVFQNVYLFEDSVFNNIKFGKPDATKEEVINASKLARCHDFIMNLKDGYDTIIEEGGASLSGGEKQRISIARAILKDAPIVILDEATSALDAENEHEIISAVNALTKNKTVIMIAHRINTVKNADHIISLDNGVITEEGTPTELENKGGIYSDFIKAKEYASKFEL